MSPTNQSRVATRPLLVLAQLSLESVLVSHDRNEPKCAGWRSQLVQSVGDQGMRWNVGGDGFYRVGGLIAVDESKRAVEARQMKNIVLWAQAELSDWNSCRYLSAHN